MTKVINDLKREYSLYSERDLKILAKKYFGITGNLTKNALIDRMVSIELSNSYR